jgi:hypothetical protein
MVAGSDFFQKKIIHLCIGLVITVFFTIPVSAQVPCQLSMTVNVVPVEQLSIVDIDFQRFESRSLLFTLNITSNSLIPVDARLHISMDIMLADGSVLNGAIPDVASSVFSVPPDGRVLTNLNIGRNSPDVKFTGIQLSDEAKAKVEDVALATGRFPAGRYDVKITLEPVACGTSTDRDVIFILKNSSSVELRAPRDGETTNEFPFFEFYKDCDRAVLTVAEKSPDQSREEAISHQPSMLEAELGAMNSFLYSGGRPLEQNKSYVWQIVCKNRVSGGTDNEVKSVIGVFTVSETAGAGTDDAILRQLEEILGPRYEAIFTQLRDGNFKLSGNYTNNNVPISQSELLNLINELREVADSAELGLE